ncbi:shTK domain protein [Ancylostoma ceylanicum]|uniref:ShTK domain protein n=1 Tax=Ancylostoma ceylanicum TaxID=53326 RepID=A0A0D6LR89_9BILA|nr:shTK domain protein [Ancylostoma ceylanicum]
MILRLSDFFTACVAGKCTSSSETCITTTTGQFCCETSKVRTSPPATSTATTCVDKVNPQTGISDCPQRTSLCNDSRYYTLMTEQCPKTCNRCHDTPVTTTASPNCYDLVNPRTGVSDCPRYAHLCNDAYYYTYMTEQCPKTCNRCPGSSASGQSALTEDARTSSTLGQASQIAHDWRHTADGNPTSP